MIIKVIKKAIEERKEEQLRREELLERKLRNFYEAQVEATEIVMQLRKEIGIH